jgi:hypothetical protein
MPMKMEETECSETLSFKLQTSVNHPEESIGHSEHGESLKSGIKNRFNAGNAYFFVVQCPVLWHCIENSKD